MLLFTGQVTLAQEDSPAQNNTDDNRHLSKTHQLKQTCLDFVYKQNKNNIQKKYFVLS